jgi:hypothetical protein
MFRQRRQINSVNKGFEIDIPFTNHLIRTEYSRTIEIEKDKLNKTSKKTTTNFILNHLFFYFFLSIVKDKNNFSIESNLSKGPSIFSFFRLKFHFSIFQIKQTQIKIPDAFIFILRQSFFNCAYDYNFGFYGDYLRISFGRIELAISKRNLKIFFISFFMTILTYVCLTKLKLS